MRPDELLAILRKAHAVVADSRQWTARNFAEDELGRWVPVGSQRATRFNLAGAVTRCAGASAHEVIGALEMLLSAAPRELKPEMLGYSQGSTQEQALSLLAWAMTRLEASGFERPTHSDALQLAAPLSAAPSGQLRARPDR